MSYAVLKVGVYIQGVWIVDTEEEAKNLLKELIEKDCDDYHTYQIVISGKKDLLEEEMLFEDKKKPLYYIVKTTGGDFVRGLDTNNITISAEEYQYKEYPEIGNMAVFCRIHKRFK